MLVVLPWLWVEVSYEIMVNCPSQTCWKEVEFQTLCAVLPACTPRWTLWALPLRASLGGRNLETTLQEVMQCLCNIFSCVVIVRFIFSWFGRAFFAAHVYIFWRINSEFICSLCHVRSWGHTNMGIAGYNHAWCMYVCTYVRTYKLCCI